MKKTAIIIAILALFQSLNSQTTVTSFSTLIKTNHNFGLTNPVFDENSPMSYMPSDVDTKGAAFTLNYTNQGGTSFDGYPSGTVGGFKTGGTYYPGNFSACGMPIQIQDLTHELRINWQTFQINANDANDKWWATINVIFDGGTETSQPDTAARDYDLVIQNVSYLQDDFEDLINPGGRYWYFARETPGGAIKPFTVYLDGIAYSWAVRYKFFDYPPGDPNEDKNDKVHIKFIPIDNSNPIPRLDHSLKLFIDTTLDYITYLPLTASELALANQKVAESTLWIKSISAGFEVYEGASTLGNEHFYTTIDNTAPSALTNLSATLQSGSIALNWDESVDSALDFYNIYRSENSGAFSLIASEIRTNSYLDDTIDENLYDYYVTAIDRSFNESSQSNIATVNTLSNNTNFKNLNLKIYPNPTTSELNIQIDGSTINGLMYIYDVTGRLIHHQEIKNTLTKLTLECPEGVYFVKVKSSNGNTMVKQIIKM
jgi:hypothetical protein